MRHQRNIATEQSNRDLRWSSARTVLDCNAYMAIEAQRAGAIGFAFIRRPENGIRGPNWMRGATCTVEGHYRYGREIMGITEEDQFYA